MKPRTQRRIEALARMDEREQRTPEDQLRRLDAAGWRAEKERRRLQALIQRKRAA